MKAIHAFPEQCRIRRVRRVDIEDRARAGQVGKRFECSREDHGVRGRTTPLQRPEKIWILIRIRGRVLSFGGENTELERCIGCKPLQRSPRPVTGTLDEATRNTNSLCILDY